MSPAQRAARERMLDNLRRDGSQSMAARYSAIVTVIKKLLPLAAVLLLGLLAVAPSLRLGPDSNRVSYHVQKVPGNETASKMQDAKYHGIDQQGQPFTVTANAADDQGSDSIALQKPEGDITLKSGAWVMLRSDTGWFHQKAQHLDLSGNVSLYRNDGTTLTVATAGIDLLHGNAASSAPVQVQGPFGTLNALNGFSLTDRGADITFHGPATLTLISAGAGSGTK